MSHLMSTPNGAGTPTSTAKQASESDARVCFVIMPIADSESYDLGHWRRVYEHIVRPACVLAGFKPVRADDVNQTNHIVLDVLRQLLNAEMAICDLSGRNPNVFYELGIRQAFNKPVCLIKDIVTPRVFDIQGLRDIEYDHGLRVDTIQPTVVDLADSLRNTFSSYLASDGQVNSLVQLLGLNAAALPQPSELSAEGSLVLSSLAELSSRMAGLEQVTRASIGERPPTFADLIGHTETRRSWSADAVSRWSHARPSALPSGTRVLHPKFGGGVVVESLGVGKDEKVKIDFDDEAIGRKTLVLDQAPLVIG